MRPTSIREDIKKNPLTKIGEHKEIKTLTSLTKKPQNPTTISFNKRGREDEKWKEECKQSSAELFSTLHFIFLHTSHTNSSLFIGKHVVLPTTYN